jgi:cephalosporin hydroxylase
LYDVKPDLVIETGTNAGGFSVYLATLLTAWNPNATILTVDSQPLKKWQQRFGGDLPTEKEAWKKSVIYKQSFSNTPDFLATARRMAFVAEKVMVILDRSSLVSLLSFTFTLPIPSLCRQWP